MRAGRPQVCSPERREQLLTRVRVHLAALKRQACGKHICARVEKLLDTTRLAQLEQAVRPQNPAQPFLKTSPNLKQESPALKALCCDLELLPPCVLVLRDLRPALLRARRGAARHHAPLAAVAGTVAPHARDSKVLLSCCWPEPPWHPLACHCIA